MLFVNDVRLRFHTPDGNPLRLRLNEYCLLPFCTQMAVAPKPAATQGFTYVLVEETGLAISFSGSPCGPLTLIRDSNSKALVM